MVWSIVSPGIRYCYYAGWHIHETTSYADTDKPIIIYSISNGEQQHTTANNLNYVKKFILRTTQLSLF